jgi:hypothetical protein
VAFPVVEQTTLVDGHIAYVIVAGIVAGAVVGAVLGCSEWEDVVGCADSRRLTRTSESGGRCKLLAAAQLVRWIPSARFASWTSEEVGAARLSARKAVVAMMLRKNIL